MKERWELEELKSLNCIRCGKNLLHPIPYGNVIFVYKWPEDGTYRPRKLLKIYYTCKSCEHPELRKLIVKGNNIYDGWKDISDLFIPEVLFQWLVGIILNLYKGDDTYTDEAMEELMRLIFVVSVQYEKKVNLTTEQKKELKFIKEWPRFLGGLG